MTIVFALAAAGLATYALRLLPARWAGGRPLPAPWQRGLAVLGPVAFAALAAPAVVIGGGTVAPAGARLAAVAAALPVARSTRSVGATLAVGMPTLWLATALTAS